MYDVFHRFEAFLKKVNAQAVTVGCPSNGRRASSISALPAPAAQTSADGTACSVLPAASCAAAQASPPHRTPIAVLAIPLLTHTCCYSLAAAHEPVNPRTPLHVGNNYQVFLGSVSFPSKASPSSTALVLSVRRGQRMTSIRSGMYVERLKAGSMATQKQMPPYYVQNNDSST